MARRPGRQPEDEGDDRDDEGDDRGERRRRGVKPPQASNSTLIIFLAIGGAAVIAVVGYIAMGGSPSGLSPDEKRRYEKEQKAERQTREEEEDERAQRAAGTYKEPEPNEITVTGRTVEEHVGSLLLEAKRLAFEQLNLDKANEALDMALQKDPAYKGDVLFYRGLCQTEYARGKGIKGSAVGPYWDKALEFYTQAKAAYSEAGAKSTWSGTMQERMNKMDQLIKMGEIQKTHDVAK